MSTVGQITRIGWLSSYGGLSYIGELRGLEDHHRRLDLTTREDLHSIEDLTTREDLHSLEDLTTREDRQSIEDLTTREDRQRRLDLTPRPPLHNGEGGKPTGEGGKPTGERGETTGEWEENGEKGAGIVRGQLINPEKLELAKHFRKNPTEKEDKVWQMLRNRQIKNLKWRRQQVIDGFIADFYCADLNVVLEIDGPVHDNKEEKEYDDARTEVFNTKGIKTYRLKNEDCDHPHLLSLINSILKQAHNRPLPLSTMERGPGGEVQPPTEVHTSTIFPFIEKQQKPWTSSKNSKR